MELNRRLVREQVGRLASGAIVPSAFRSWLGQVIAGDTVTGEEEEDTDLLMRVLYALEMEPTDVALRALAARLRAVLDRNDSSELAESLVMLAWLRDTLLGIATPERSDEAVRRDLLSFLRERRPPRFLLSSIERMPVSALANLMQALDREDYQRVASSLARGTAP